MADPALELNDADMYGGTAGFGIRAGARIADWVFTMVLGFVAGILGVLVLAILAAAGAAPSDWLERAQHNGLGSYVWGFVASTLYHAASEAIGGTSLGKLVFGLRVLSEDYTPCRVKGALVRSLGFLVDGLFFGLIGYTSMNKSALQQRYGDVWGGTIVVRAAAVPEASRKGAGPIVLGLFGGCAAAVLCNALGIILNALN